MPGIKISKILEETSLLGDADSPQYGIEMARVIYDEIPGDKYKVVKNFIKGNAEIKDMFD